MVGSREDHAACDWQPPPYLKETLGLAATGRINRRSFVYEVEEALLRPTEDQLPEYLLQCEEEENKGIEEMLYIEPENRMRMFSSSSSRSNSSQSEFAGDSGISDSYIVDECMHGYLRNEYPRCPQEHEWGLDGPQIYLQPMENVHYNENTVDTLMDHRNAWDQVYPQDFQEPNQFPATTYYPIVNNVNQEEGYDEGMTLNPEEKEEAPHFWPPNVEEDFPPLTRKAGPGRPPKYSIESVKPGENEARARERETQARARKKKANRAKEQREAVNNSLKMLVPKLAQLRSVDERRCFEGLIGCLRKHQSLQTGNRKPGNQKVKKPKNKYTTKAESKEALRENRRQHAKTFRQAEIQEESFFTEKVLKHLESIPTPIRQGVLQKAIQILEAAPRKEPKKSPAKRARMSM